MSRPSTTPAPGLAGPLLAYTAARLGILAVVAGLLVIAGVPLLLAALIGLIVAMPLSMVLLKGLRVRLDAALTVVRARRAAEREVLRARLRGEDLRGEDLRGEDLRGEDLRGEDLAPDRSVDSAGAPSVKPPSAANGDPSNHAAEREPDADEHRPGQQ